MKTSIIPKALFALSFSLALAASAAEHGMMQRAAANHFELPSTSAPRNTALPATVVERGLGGGKHWAQIQELYERSVSSRGGVDLAHAPRPVTASKDPDLERKWRANASMYQLAPVK